MILELSENEYQLLRRALGSHYYVCLNENELLWEIKEIDKLERKLISLFFL